MSVSHRLSERRCETDIVLFCRRSTSKHLCWRALRSLGHALEEAEHGARLTERCLLVLSLIQRVEQRWIRDAPAACHHPGSVAAWRKVRPPQPGERGPNQGGGVEAVVMGCRRQERLGPRQVMGQDESAPQSSAQFLPDRPHPGTLLVQSVMKQHLLVAVDGNQPDNFDTGLFPLEVDVDAQDAEVVEREQVVQQGDAFPAGEPRELLVAPPQRLERRGEPGEGPLASGIGLKLSNEQSNGTDRLELLIAGRASDFTTLLFDGSEQFLNDCNSFIKLLSKSGNVQSMYPFVYPGVDDVLSTCTCGASMEFWSVVAPHSRRARAACSSL